MSTITVVDKSGAEHRIDGADGRSVMEMIRLAGIDDLLALCGGCLSCATCHVFVDDADFGRVGPPGVDEEDLLDSSNCRAATSRLSCQIRFSDALDGIRVTIAPEE